MYTTPSLYSKERKKQLHSFEQHADCEQGGAARLAVHKGNKIRLNTPLKLGD